MPNANTIARAQGPLPGDQMLYNGGAEQYFDDDNGTDAIVSVAYDQVKGRSFVVRANGTCLAAAACNLSVLLDAGDSTTIASNTTIGTTGAVALDTDSTVMTWGVQAILKIAQTSSKLSGIFSGWVNNTMATEAVAVESVEDLVANGVLSFKVTSTVSGSNAANYAQLDQLEIDIL